MVIPYNEITPELQTFQGFRYDLRSALHLSWVSLHDGVQEGRGVVTHLTDGEEMAQWNQRICPWSTLPSSYTTVIWKTPGKSECVHRYQSQARQPS